MALSKWYTWASLEEQSPVGHHLVKMNPNSPSKVSRAGGTRRLSGFTLCLAM